MYVLAQDPDSDRFSAAERGFVVPLTVHFILRGFFFSGPPENGTYLQETS
jgi:hypothetical protein